MSDETFNPTNELEHARMRQSQQEYLDLRSQNQALQERVMEAQAAADDANTFLSHNRGISGFIADDDPQRPTNGSRTLTTSATS